MARCPTTLLSCRGWPRISTISHVDMHKNHRVEGQHLPSVNPSVSFQSHPRSVKVKSSLKVGGLAGIPPTGISTNADIAEQPKTSEHQEFAVVFAQKEFRRAHLI
jgi:hypothetical protein